MPLMTFISAWLSLQACGAAIKQHDRLSTPHALARYYNVELVAFHVAINNILQEILEGKVIDPLLSIP